jgi:anthranilate synthase component I
MMTSQTLTPPHLVVRRRLDDIETPVSALLKLGADEPGILLFESVLGGERRGRYSFIGYAPDLWWRVKDGVAETAKDHTFAGAIRSDLPPLEALRVFNAACAAQEDEPLPPMAAGAFGMLGFDMIRHFENLGTPNPDPLDMPDAVLMRPSVVLVFDSIRQEILLISPARREPGESEDQARQRAEARLDAVETRLDAPFFHSPEGGPLEGLSFVSNTSPDQYMDMVRAAKRYIEAGDVFQVVPSQRLSARFEIAPVALFRAIRRLNPSPFMFYINFGGFQLVGASPEILVRLRDGRVTVRPIAGTLPRGKTEAEDHANEEALLADPKERAEHMMLLDLGRNDVGRVAKAGSVKVTERFVVERYSHVMHIVSNVEGELKPGQDAVSALMAGFPAGTVSGAPKIRAMEIIDELEVHKRTFYGGGVGYIGHRGDMDTCIALRTAMVKDKTLHLQAGAGIVLDSVPQKEHEECLHKAQALIRAAREAGRYVGKRT